MLNMECDPIVTVEGIALATGFHRAKQGMEKVWASEKKGKVEPLGYTLNNMK